MLFSHNTGRGPSLHCSQSGDYTLSLGILLLLLHCCSLLCATITWAVHSPMRWWNLPVAGLLTLCVMWGLHVRWQQGNVRSFLRLLLTAGAITAFAIALATYAYDYAYDGMSYHQPIIHSLMQGWNPLYTPQSPQTAGWPCSAYVDHYPKGLETHCAAFALCCGNIEAGKAANLQLIVASFCFASCFVKAYFGKRFAPTTRQLLALLLTLSPVTLSQALTFYVDFALYAYLLIGFSMCYLGLHQTTEHPTPYASNSKVVAPVVAMVVALAIATKATAAFWTLLLLVVAIAVALCKKHPSWRSIARGMICGTVLGLLVFGFHPYITHLQQGRHMLHPFMGAEAVDIHTIQAEALAHCSRAEAVVRSLFSRPTDGGIESVSGYLPRMSNVISSGKADVRMGGGGIFFIEMLLLTPVLLWLTRRRSPQSTRCCIALILTLIASLFIVPGGWWIRFAPFTYAIPLCAYFHFLKYTPRGDQRLLKHCATAIITINVLTVGIVSLLLMQMHRSKVNYLTDVLRQSPPVRLHTHNLTFVHLLDRQAIPYYLVSSAPRQLIFPGPPVYCHREEWNTQGLHTTDYPLLRLSNIRQDIVYP